MSDSAFHRTISKEARRYALPSELWSIARLGFHGLAERAAHLRQRMEQRRLAARAYTREHGDDDPEIRDWAWPY